MYVHVHYIQIHYYDGFDFAMNSIYEMLKSIHKLMLHERFSFLCV